ncbi:MAG TPA: hypothetical protein VN838_03370 [Bradyrhizobium sp.]|nr:hypothetical protein [Bradyrhizobium sp.]
MERPEIEVWKNSTDIQGERREKLISEFDSIADRIFKKEPAALKQLEAFFFNETTGVALASDSDRLVGYNIYKRLQMSGKTVLYSAVTNVRPEYQSGGLRRRFLKSVLRSELNSNDPGSVFLAFRTRNPIIWHVFSQCCDPLVPNYRAGSTIDEELVDLGVAVAKEIFPKLEVERPTMIMRNAFDWISYQSQPLHKDPEINQAFFKDLSGTDGIFAIGKARGDLLESWLS